MPRTSRRFTPAQRQLIAYHEAGHAIIHHALGYGFVRVSVFERPSADREDGHVVYDPATIIPYTQKMLIGLAGAIAEHRFAKRRPLMTLLLTCGRSDWSVACKAAKQLAADSGTPMADYLLLQVAEQQAKQLIQRRWEDVERVAQALIERGTLSHAEFLEIVTSAPCDFAPIWAHFTRALSCSDELLITASQFDQLLANAPVPAATGTTHDPVPVVELVLPRIRWLLVWVYPNDRDRAFAVIKFGNQTPGAGDVLLSDIANTRFCVGSYIAIRPKRDKYIRLDQPLSFYLDNPNAW